MGNKTIKLKSVKLGQELFDDVRTLKVYNILRDKKGKPLKNTPFSHVEVMAGDGGYAKNTGICSLKESGEFGRLYTDGLRSMKFTSEEEAAEYLNKHFNKSSLAIRETKQMKAFRLLKREGHRFGQGEFIEGVDYVWELNNAQIQPLNSTKYLRM